MGAAYWLDQLGICTGSEEFRGTAFGLFCMAELIVSRKHLFYDRHR